MYGCRLMIEIVIYTMYWSFILYSLRLCQVSPVVTTLAESVKIKYDLI